jgi:hypothetical protein
MTPKETSPPYSVVNCKLMRATSTARIEVTAREAAALLNDFTAACTLLVDSHTKGTDAWPSIIAAQAALSKARG